MVDDRKIAYFSMEIGVDPEIPTYSGGLGVLAGDTIRSAADLEIPLVGVTLLHRKGYFFQKLDAAGVQQEENVQWVVEDFLQPVDGRASVTICGRTVQLCGWQRLVLGQSGYAVPVYFLSADLPENDEQDGKLTDFLYGGDAQYRLCQEIILGIGGLRLLRTYGYQSIQRFHMNEGHAALLAIELLDEHLRRENRQELRPEDIDAVRQRCVFTTHTPVSAGHDQFPAELVSNVMGKSEAQRITELFRWDHSLNMTYLGLNFSRYVNGVAKKHAEVAGNLFAQYEIDSITNGVHAATWVSPPVAELLDRCMPGWRADNYSLRYAESLPKIEIWKAHTTAKQQLIHHVNRETNIGMDVDHFTIGFARRAATYKRADLFFHDLDRLRQIARNAGPLQVVYAGKAHPHDQGGKGLIQRIFKAIEALRGDIKVLFLANHDMNLAKLLTSGVDLWLNTPRPPLEASGTSGMKAALNGVPSLSILDGWWIEGCIEGVTGWAIERSKDANEGNDYGLDAASLYQKLEQVILPMFYHDTPRYQDIMRHCIAINGSFFNTERMMHEYVLKAYFR